MMRSWQIDQSLSLKSYGTLKPSALNLRRSSKIAWNQHSANSSFLYLNCWPHRPNCSSVTRLYSVSMFARRPLGGSVVILMPRCRIVMGNSLDGGRREPRPEVGVRLGRVESRPARRSRPR